MTLQQMRYFIAVAQNLSFSKAAQQHYVSQTAVSQQIKLLEEELETELFQRTRHSVALTSAGQVFYEYAVRITDLAEDAARRTRAAAAECSTPLEIGMMSGMENLPILEKLLLFKEQHPAIPLHFHLVDFPTLKKRLQQKKLDFALQLELVPLEDTPSLLRAQVGQLRQYVVLNRQSHLSSYASLHRSQLASEQYYVPAMDRELWNQFAQVLTRHGSDPQNIKFAYSMEELMLQLAFYGGYTILAEPVLAQLPANKNLTFIPLENDTVPAWAVWNRENISPALRLLLRSWILTRDMLQNALTILRKSAALFSEIQQERSLRRCVEKCKGRSHESKRSCPGRFHSFAGPCGCTARTVFLPATWYWWQEFCFYHEYAVSRKPLIYRRLPAHLLWIFYVDAIRVLDRNKKFHVIRLGISW